VACRVQNKLLGQPSVFSGGRMRTGENVSAIAREFSVSRPTIYRAVGA
jgi:hypothetical protein